jgi:hypothetical protein
MMVRNDSVLRFPVVPVTGILCMLPDIWSPEITGNFVTGLLSRSAAYLARSSSDTGVGDIYIDGSLRTGSEKRGEVFTEYSGICPGGR